MLEALEPPLVSHATTPVTCWISASIVHDLRNPLATVVAASEMLMELDSSSAQATRLAANIFRAAGRMRGLLADLAGASHGRGSTSEICKIRDIIAAACDAVLPVAEKHSVHILNHISGDTEVRLERSRIERVFFNLITNALEAMPHGGNISIDARKADQHVLIEVEDTGPGIPAGIRDRLFQPFVTLGKNHGLGLGLALSRQTVLDHGGDMWIEPAAGARFVIRLPLTQPVAPERAAAIAANSITLSGLKPAVTRDEHCEANLRKRAATTGSGLKSILTHTQIATVMERTNARALQQAPSATDKTDKLAALNPKSCDPTAAQPH
jgi:nitrogen-specific signal transduction histidine kinase